MTDHSHAFADPFPSPRFSWDSRILLFSLVLGLHGVVLHALLRSESASQPTQVSSPVAEMMGTLIAPPPPTAEPEPAPEPTPEPAPEPAPEPTPESKPEPISTATPEPKPKPVSHPTVKSRQPRTKARQPIKAVESHTPVQHAAPHSAQLATSPAPVQEQTPPPVVQPRLDARAGNNPPPEYPRIARMRGQEGTVVLSLVIGADGSVQEVSVLRSCGYPLLDQSAIRAVRHWHFHPATQGGKAISWKYSQPIKFSLTN